jgi:hypothetical protein
MEKSIMKKMLVLLTILISVFAGGLGAQTVSIVSWPQYTPSDSTTPFAMYITVSCTTTYARVRAYDYAGLETGTDYTWGDSTWAGSGNLWCRSNGGYADNPRIAMSSGTWAGWLFAKVSGNGADTLSQIRVRFRQQQSTGTILSANYTATQNAKHIVMDPAIPSRLYYGGWLKGHIYSDVGTSSPFANIAVLAFRTDSIVGTYVTENNHVDETHDSTDIGYFRMSVPEGQIDSLRFYDMSNGMVTGYTKTSRPWSITRGIETNIDGTGVEGNSETIVSSTSIKISAAPNPARVMTQISFSLPSAGMAEVTVYNIAGQKVASLVSENLSAGKHSLTWNLKDAKGNAVPNGVYFYQLTAGNRTLSQKIVVVR